jgi:plasmid stabilization system protein ParE
MVHGYLREAAPEAARRWVAGMRRTIESLGNFPERGRLASESASFGEPVREALYGRGNWGTYRILYAVTGDTVFVLHVRHGSRLPAEPGSGELF